MPNYRTVLTLAAVLFAGAVTSIFTQSPALHVTSNKPIVDGVVQPGEYSYMHDFDHQLVLYASRTADTLYLAAVGKAGGWVAVGLGSKKMDGSAIFIGYVGSDGKVSFKAQLGKGKRHVDPPSDIAATVKSYAIKQQNGTTTLELAVDASYFIKPGQSALEIIFAMADERSFTAYHSYRGATSLALQ